ncbi:MAG: TetR/AcrR family transcriptional regulator C-terminal domain-containing protein [Eubacteriaceae bacterium]|nr:TetR/AcrR family transcriptional regulator C-terminal domain-containing protein [Eubacteriaceae bacterium]
MKKEDQRIVLTKRLLADALTELLKHKDLDKINVTELCRKAGINRATFYRHYETVSDIMDEMQDRLVREIRLMSNEPKNSGEVRDAIKKIASHLYEQRELVRLILKNNADEKMAMLFNEIYKKIMEDKDLLNINFSASPKDIKFIATFIAGGTYAMLKEWIMSDEPEHPDRISKLACELFLDDRFTNV